MHIPLLPVLTSSAHTLLPHHVHQPPAAAAAAAAAASAVAAVFADPAAALLADAAAVAFDDAAAAVALAMHSAAAAAAAETCAAAAETCAAAADSAPLDALQESCHQPAVHTVHAVPDVHAVPAVVPGPAAAVACYHMKSHAQRVCWHVLADQLQQPQLWPKTIAVPEQVAWKVMMWLQKKTKGSELPFAPGLLAAQGL